jgi:hypothetical protein
LGLVANLLSCAKFHKRCTKDNERERKKERKKRERITITSLDRVEGIKTIKENQHARKKVKRKTRCICIAKIGNSKLCNIQID